MQRRPGQELRDVGTSVSCPLDKRLMSFGQAAHVLWTGVSCPLDR